MFTIFTIPKSFTDPHISIIQKNAIKSWLSIDGAEVILVGNDTGVKEVAIELGIKHIAGVKTNQFGTPLLDSAFSLVKQVAKNDIIIYSNADIILPNGLKEALVSLLNTNFLAVGRRTDLDVVEEIDFTNKNATSNLEQKALKEGILHSPTGIDYFIFRKNSHENLPPLAVGRVGWDIWMTSNAKEKKIPLIDLTDSVLAIHQNHAYPAYNKGVERKTNPEAVENYSYIKTTKYIGGIADADWRLVNNKLIKNKTSLISKLKSFLKRLNKR